MTTVILSVVIVTIIGIIAGVGLSVASVIMKVPVDEKAQQIREALPGANCGACGFSGCDGYAKALSEGKTDKTNLCAPGGQAAADKIAEIMGVSGGVAEKRVAKVKCLGTCDKTDTCRRRSPVLRLQRLRRLCGGVPRKRHGNIKRNCLCIRRKMRRLRSLRQGMSQFGHRGKSPCKTHGQL